MEQIPITRLIPQRDPIRMVDALESCGEGQAVTIFEVKPGNFFLDDDGLLAVPGMVEHIAQSASAMAGYEALQVGADNPPVGYIGEVKNFVCHRRPHAGERLTTTIEKGPEVEGVTIVRGETRVGDEVVAETQMKIYIDE